MKELEKNCWYWFTDPREGDIWYPVYVRSDSKLMIDNQVFPQARFKALTFVKAIMPD